MSAGYYQHVRSEIAALLPPTADRILEVGCGSGATLGWLRSRYPQAATTGVEGFAGNLDAIRAVADHAIIANLDEPLPELGPFDLILALDVLEHLRSPEGVLKTLVGLLAPGGTVIVSLPAVSHISVAGPLLFQRKFPYADAGILDRTHLRLFVEESSLQLMNGAGLRVTAGVVNGLEGRATRLFDSLTLGVFRHWLSKQYIMRGESSSEPVAQPAVRWKRGRKTA